MNKENDGIKRGNDLISRQAAIEALEKPPHKVWDIWADEYTVGELVQWEKDVKALECVPSAESETIRCKDCKWFGGIGCAIRIVDDSDKPKEDDFCSFAERKQIGSKLESVEKSMLVAYEPEDIKQKSKLNAEPRPCDFCIYNDDCDEMRIYCPARGRGE